MRFHRHRFQQLGTVTAPGQWVLIDKCRCGAYRKTGVAASAGIQWDFRGYVYPHPKLGVYKGVYG